MVRPVRRRGEGRGAHRRGPVDGFRRVRGPSTASQIQLGRRPAGLRLHRDRRRSAIHHARLAPGGLVRRDSPLAVFHAIAQTSQQWSRIVIWASGLGTAAAILGITLGLWMYSPAKSYRSGGAPASFPYHGQKRWHAILGLLFGIFACTWAFSGMLSMDPFPRLQSGRSERRRRPDRRRAARRHRRSTRFRPSLRKRPWPRRKQATESWQRNWR